MHDCLTETAEGVILSLKVQPRSSRNQLVGYHDGTLKVKLTAPPVDGLANICCCEFLAKLLGLPARDIELVSGTTSRYKKVFVKGLSGGEVARCLGLKSDH